jgi:hypothetical protein
VFQKIYETWRGEPLPFLQLRSRSVERIIEPSKKTIFFTQTSPEIVSSNAQAPQRIFSSFPERSEGQTVLDHNEEFFFIEFLQYYFPECQYHHELSA